MELIRGLHNVRAQHRGAVMTLGNFDGVHRGHQAVLAELRAQAAARGAPSLVMVFEPQPLEYLAEDRAPHRLYSLREKLHALASQELDFVVVARFDAALARLDAEAFVERVVHQVLGARAFLVGPDLRFGRGRKGDFALLTALAPRMGFDLLNTRTLDVAGSRVSSTRVRAALARGDLATVAQLLGRPYAVAGRVAHGDRRGRGIGFPTINLPMRRRMVRLSGVYAARVHGLGPRAYQAMAYIGTRPVVSGNTPQLEAHLFDFDRECYGEHARVELVAHLRDEIAFRSLAELEAQLARDAEAARAVLATT